MSTNFPIPPPSTATTTTTTTTTDNLFAAVDIGTNTFKLTLVRADTFSGRFLTLNRLKEPVLLGLDTATISAVALDRAIAAIGNFQTFLNSQRLTNPRLRLVATSAVREASNKSQFIDAVNEALGLDVEILTGNEEARLIYLGVLQFFPVYNSTVLTIDIGGGSTEFTVGFKGSVLFCMSLRLGHVTLTQEFTDFTVMREHIRKELESSGLIDRIKEFNIDVVIGSSGTIKAIEKAVCNGYGHKLEGNGGLFEEFVKREWRFSRQELRCLVDRLCEEEKEMDGRMRRVGFFKSRAPFILAGAILLDEVFERLRIEEIEVSGYALGEGVITEMLAQSFEGFDLNSNARWRSVVRLASRFNNKKRMKAATVCGGIAREIFGGLRKWSELHEDEGSVSLDESDIEYIDAASLLHNIGMYTGKKGYHKQSYNIILNGDHLHGYTKEEIKLIALLARYHRKKFPKRDSLDGCAKEVKQKFRILCTILRVSSAVLQCLHVDFQIVEFIHSPEGFKLIFRESETRNQSADIVQLLSEDINVTVEKELEHFRTVFNENLSIVVTT